MLATLQDIRKIFGNRRLVVARELTKLFEEILRGSVDDIMESLKNRPVKGEITLVVAGNGVGLPMHSDDDIRKRLKDLADTTDLSARRRIDQVVLEMGVPRRRVYQTALKISRS